jgi:hypothetical protein
MTFNPLTALSPLDGRYAGKVDALREHFSEFGLIRARLLVEIEWLKALAAEPHFEEIAAFSPSTVTELDALVANFSVEQAAEVKAEEAVTTRRQGDGVLAQEALGHNAEVMKCPSSSTSPAPRKTSTTPRMR